MKNTSAYAVLTRFGIIAAVLATLVFIAPAAFAATKYSVPENTSDPVARFSASDEDGDDIKWGLSGDDAGDFEISDDGVLTFAKSPNFEGPADANVDNVYKVNVTANSGSIAIEVTVTDVDEAGKVSFGGLGERQPQVGRDLTASGPADPDAPVDEVKWQWSRGSSVDGPFTDITGATSESRAPVGADEGMYLRATATYNDKHGDGKTVSGVTPNVVEARTRANAAPAFTDETGPSVDDDPDTGGNQNTTVLLRAVDEGKKGANVGKPIAAKDGDGDVLRYTINPANANYAVDPWTGQVTTKTKRNSDDDGLTGTADSDGETIEEFTVRATDPSGAFGEAKVKVTINDVNDAPAIGSASGAANQKTITVVEGTIVMDADSGTNDNQPPTYSATDADAGDGPTADTTATPPVVAFKWAVEGADKGSFSISATGALAFKDHTPNYEKQKSYSITIAVRDNETPVAGVGTLAVTVNVTNAEDDGKADLSAREPQVGKQIVASFSDEDGKVRSAKWQWYRNAVSGTNDDTDDADLAALVATTVGHRCTDDRTTLCLIHGATSPAYTPKKADEGTGKGLLAARVVYTDACVRGADETPRVCDGLGDNETDRVNSAFKVTERDVQLEDAGNTAPKFADDQDLNTAGNQAAAERSVAENADGADVGEPVNATDSDLVKFSLGGADAASFKLGDPPAGSNSVQIKTAKKLDYETKSSYSIVVTATDPSGATDDLTVNITVEDVDDSAVITGVKTYDYAENGKDSVATFTATDPDGDDIKWGKSGDDEGDFKISDDGVLTFAKSPSFESPADANVDNVYKVNVTANSGSIAVEVTVTDVDEAGKVTFGGLGERQPQVGRDLTASGPADPDAPVDEVKWQWSRGSSVDGPWTDITGATSESRAPVGADEGMYLRATATYNDKHGDGKTVSGVTPNVVEARTRANAAPAFPDEDTATTGVQVTRAVDEGKKGANVGKPITAKDGDGDVLRYTINPASDDYAVDPWTGQVTTKTKRNSDDSGTTSTTTPADADGETEETFTVRATDPSGAFGEATVTVTINDVNDAPTFTAGGNIVKTLWVTEGVKGDDLRTAKAEDGTALPDNAYVASDADAGDAHNQNITGTNDVLAVVALKYTVEGADKGSFTINASTGVLDLKSDHTPNYEGKSSYSITIAVRDNETPVAGEATVSVKVNVVNAEDDGKADLSAREPQVGKQIVASFSDDDGKTRSAKWQWYLNASNTTTDAQLNDATTLCADDTTDLCKIDGATSPAYTPKKADSDTIGSDGAVTVDKGLLAARVVYTDACVGAVTDPPRRCDPLTTGQTDRTDSAFKVTERDVQLENPGNTAPKFADDQDPNTTGNQAAAERSVAENADGADVGEPVNATDSDLVKFSLGGADAASFELGDPPTGSNSVQIKTAKKLDYETKSSYSIVVTATDPSGATDDLTVNITVEDVDDKATITALPAVNNAPAFDADTASRSVDENQAAGTNVGDPVTATDDEGETVSYSIGESMYFAIDSASGQITTTAMLDYEMMASHTLTVTATDEEDATDTIDVTITVTDAQPGCTVEGNNGLTNDCEALLDSKSALEGGGASLNWSEDTWANTWDTSKWGEDVERWDGFQSHALYPSISGDPARVTALHLQRGGILDGMIPDSLARVSELKALWIWGNNLHGDLSAVGGMKNLERLYVNNNELSGIGDISGATSLEILWAHRNDTTMTGPLVAEHLPSSLTWLSLYGNSGLGGEIPDLSGLTNLERLYLDRAGLTGAIPASLGSVTSLTHLRLKYNSLSGDIPAELGNLSNLVWLRIGNSGAYTGCLPAALLAVASTDAAGLGLDTCPADDGS